MTISTTISLQKNSPFLDNHRQKKITNKDPTWPTPGHQKGGTCLGTVHYATLAGKHRGHWPFFICLISLTSFSTAAPRRVKMIPAWEFTPTAVTSILPEPGIFGCGSKYLTCSALALYNLLSCYLVGYWRRWNGESVVPTKFSKLKQRFWNTVTPATRRSCSLLYYNRLGIQCVVLNISKDR